MLNQTVPHTHAHKTLYLHQQQKTNNNRVMFHFHTPSTENIKMSRRITPGGRCFLFYCPLFHLNYKACVGLVDSFNKQCVPRLPCICVFHTWAELELFLARKDKEGGRKRKDGVLFLAPVTLITRLWEVNSSIQLLLRIWMYSLWQGIICHPVGGRKPLWADSTFKYPICVQRSFCYQCVFIIIRPADLPHTSTAKIHKLDVQ